MISTALGRFAAIVVAMLGSVYACGYWNVGKVRDVGESVVSGPTSKTFTSTVEKAREVMARMGDALAQNRVLPNGTYGGRVRAGLTTGALETGNCQWAAEMLREGMRAAGIPDKDMFLVFGDVRTLTVMGLNPVEVNKSHCALAIIINGRPVVFDLWKHGMEKKSFAGARSSPWNAVSFPQWAVRLKHYEWFGFDNPTIQSTTTKKVDACQADLIAAWKTLNRPERRRAPEPAAGPLKSGTYIVAANGAELTWVIQVSGGSITGMCNGTESLRGSITGNQIKLRRSCPDNDPPYQDYVGKIVGSQIVGTFTGAGGSPGQRFDWSMSLTPAK